MNFFKELMNYTKSEWYNIKKNHKIKLLTLILIIIFYPLTIIMIIIGFFIGIFIELLPGKKEYDRSTYKTISNKSYFTTISNKGSISEYFTWKILNNQAEYKKTLINLYIPNNNHTSEIDSILINQHGIFVIESKGYSGWIFGNENDTNWTQIIYKNKTKFYNPVIQNRNHIIALINLLKIYKKDVFRSYVVFSKRCTLKKINIFKPNIRVIKRNQLQQTLNDDYEKYGVVLNNEQIDDIYNKLSHYMISDKKIKQEHKEYVEKLKI